MALRKGDSKRTFTTLQEIDTAHIRGNPEFRWYFDGPPSKGFAKLMDAYLGLPNLAYSLKYEGVSFGTKMELERRPAEEFAFHSSRPTMLKCLN